MLPLNNKSDGWERPILCDEKIFQFGDAIAIVAADTEAHARAAADAVRVDIEELPAYMSVPEAIAPDAIEIHPGVPNAYYETNCIKGDDFDWDSVEDKNMIEIESYCSRQPHLHLEPDCGYAYIDEDGMAGIEASRAVPCQGLYSKDEAQAEASRCIQCHCDECIRGCAYLQHYKKYPKKLTREIYNNAHIIMRPM